MNQFQMYSLGDGIISNNEFLANVHQLIQSDCIVKNNKDIEYYNLPAAFDIEVSSFYDHGNKAAVMYIWQFGVWNWVTVGRTWDEFEIFIKKLKFVMNISNERRLCVYVHNLSYEFQFIRKLFTWDEVFLLEERKPVYALMDGIEFRCSLKLSGGKSLKSVGKDLQKYKVLKAVGDLDYNTVRTPLTPLTSRELYYCENDIRVLLAYIQETIETDGDILKTPLTKTGYVRNFCRKQCYKRWRNYRNLMEVLQISFDEYSQLKRAYMGGFTHANHNFVNKVVYNVGSYDIASSYPAVMVFEKFPMSKLHRISGEIYDTSFDKLLHTKACLFDLEIWDVVPRVSFEHPITKSKCFVCEGYVVDNGRIVTARHLITTVTEQDYFVYKEFYEWKNEAVYNLSYYDKNYLPKNFVLSILSLYNDKTKLKGVSGREIDYLIAKGMINACYGMVVTDPLRSSIKYCNDTGEYDTIPYEGEYAINKYNTNIRRFLYYPWGVWVTAYARANLFSAILATGGDYIYSDTDSVKMRNPENHREYFDRYNATINEKIRKAAAYHNISIDLFKPFDKVIGIWENEGLYTRFKTLGAKRYLVEKSGKYQLTVSGTDKEKSMEYLLLRGDPFREIQRRFENTG